MGIYVIILGVSVFLLSVAVIYMNSNLSSCAMKHYYFIREPYDRVSEIEGQLLQVKNELRTLATRIYIQGMSLESIIEKENK